MPQSPQDCGSAGARATGGRGKRPGPCQARRDSALAGRERGRRAGAAHQKSSLEAISTRNHREKTNFSRAVRPWHVSHSENSDYPRPTPVAYSITPKPSRGTNVPLAFATRFARSLVTSFGDRPVSRAKLDICRARRDLSGVGSTVSIRGRRDPSRLGQRAKSVLDRQPDTCPARGS